MSSQYIDLPVEGSTGTVTSVALTVPSILSVSGSPITSSGTLAISLATESANRVLAGPTTGSAATPTFRALVAADIPTLNQNTTGTAANITASSNSSLTTLALTSNPSVGGAVSEALTVTGLLTTDTILSVTQMTQGGSTRTSLPLIGWDTVINGGLTGQWVADPGAGAVLLVAVKR